jgi:hypothetical protein
MRMAMKKRRMRGGRRQATYAKLCRVAKLHPGHRGKTPCIPTAARVGDVRMPCLAAAPTPPRRPRPRALHPSPTPQPRMFRPHQETAMDPDPHPRGAIATLSPALSFSRLPGPAAETSAHPQG